MDCVRPPPLRPEGSELAAADYDLSAALIAELEELLAGWEGNAEAWEASATAYTVSLHDPEEKRTVEVISKVAARAYRRCVDNLRGAIRRARGEEPEQLHLDTTAGE